MVATTVFLNRELIIVILSSVILNMRTRALKTVGGARGFLHPFPCPSLKLRIKLCFDTRMVIVELGPDAKDKALSMPSSVMWNNR
jgi:hypothetical protein